ncbi:IclR family transcriptional regulator [Natronobiforma cellulositropha]|uniref:IclR family transcriptional regulator n=1 Tax=Natronobiforma cellulositropha TaxID=1679076 RepID=UPI0021D5BB6A|nr:IclR family transcriptional regulator [Natronobiforma cellulositropha]
MAQPTIDSENTVKSVETSFHIVEYLKDVDGARVTEVADALGIAKSTVHRHLVTLVEIGCVVKEGDIYDVGFRFLEFGEYAKTRKAAYAMAEEKVKELAAKTEERAQFLVEEHGQSVFVYRETGRNAVQTDPGIGKRVPIHASAAGKAILAHLPTEEVREIIDQHGLVALTEHTITDPDALFAELEEIRERGYALNNQENIDSLRAVGVPVLGNNDQVIGSLSVSGPTHRFKGQYVEREIPDLLLGTANELELNIKYS